MARTLIFVAEFTKSKVKTTPANAPTIDIADMLAPTGSLLVSGGSPTQLTNMTGVYIYSYSAADGVLPVGLMRTADTTVDLQDVPCLPLPFGANGNVKATVDAILGTLLTESSAGYLAAAFKKLFDVVTPVLTAASVNQTGDAYARLGAPVGASISADIASAAANVLTLLSRLGAFTGTGVNTVIGFLLAMMKKDASAPSDIGGTYTPTTDALEALAERITSAEVTIVSAVSGSEIDVYRGTTWDIDLTVGDITGNSKVWFTVKRDLETPDTDAYLQVEKSAGLVRFGGAAGTAGDATLVVNNAATGDITVTVKSSTTVNAELVRALSFDVKALIGTDPSVKAVGTLSVLSGATRAIS